MWPIGIWIVIIALTVSYSRSTSLDIVPRLLLYTVVTCGPYWLLFREELKKLPAATIFWRSAGVWFVGLMLGTLLYGLLSEFGGGSFDFEHDCSIPRYCN